MTAPTAFGAISVELIDDLGRFHRVAGEWDQAVAADPGASVHTTHGWLRRWWASVGEQAAPRFQVARDRVGVCGVAPWTGHVKNFGPVSLSGIGLAGGHLFSRSQVAIARRGPETVAAMLAGLSELGPWYVDPGRISSTGMLDRLLRDRQGPMTASWRCAYRLPRADVRAGWDAYRASRARGLRKELRKRYAAPNLGVRTWPDGLWTAGDMIHCILAVSAASWSHLAGTGIASSELDRSFWSGAIGDAAENGSLRAVLVFDGDRPVAFSFGIVHRGVLFGCKTAYAEDARRTGAGQLAMGALFRLACEDPAIDLVDLDCITAHGEYKLAWATELQALNSWYLFPKGAATRAVAGAYDLRSRFKVRRGKNAPVRQEDGR